MHPVGQMPIIPLSGRNRVCQYGNEAKSIIEDCSDGTMIVVRAWVDKQSISMIFASLVDR